MSSSYKLKSASKHKILLHNTLETTRETTARDRHTNIALLGKVKNVNYKQKRKQDFFDIIDI